MKVGALSLREKMTSISESIKINYISSILENVNCLVLKMCLRKKTELELGFHWIGAWKNTHKKTKQRHSGWAEGQARPEKNEDKQLKISLNKRCSFKEDLLYFK